MGKRARVYLAIGAVLIVVPFVLGFLIAFTHGMLIAFGYVHPSPLTHTSYYRMVMLSLAFVVIPKYIGGLFLIVAGVLFGVSALQRKEALSS